MVETCEAWFDLECPDCLRALTDVRLLRERYGAALSVRLRHFPLPRHPNAHAAAQAAVEAERQGGHDATWRYATAALEALDSLGEPGQLALLATAVGLDGAAVAAALADGRHAARVDADLAEGHALGVTGTPTYRARGVRFDGGRSQDGLRARLEAVLDSPAPVDSARPAPFD